MLNMEHPEYLALKKRLMTGWQTWNVYSVLSHVRMDDGLALNLAVKEYRSGHYLKEALIGRHPVGAIMHERDVEDVLPGLHAYDGSYTQATVRWQGMEFTVESTQDGKVLVLLVTPVTLQKWPAMLVLETGFLWNRPGWVEHREERLTAHSALGDMELYTSGSPALHDANIPAQGPYFACAFTEPITFSTGRQVSPQEARALLDSKKQALQESFQRYGQSAPIYEAIQCAVAWDTTYDGKKDRVASPISRLWSIGAGGFILACWDNYFVSYMASLEDKDLAYANIIEITREQTERGFVPNIAHASGYSSEDRSQPPVGSSMLLELYRRYREPWLAEYLYPSLKIWNDWFFHHRRNEKYGGFCWGSDPYEGKRGNYWETAGVNDTYGGALESGMDNSPMYDDIPFDKEAHVMMLEDVGLTGLYILDCRSLIQVAEIAGHQEDIPELERRLALAQKGLERMWDEKTGCYLNLRTDTGEFSPRLSPTHFYALFDRQVPAERARRMAQEHYYNPNEFYGQWMIPAIARNDSGYGDQDYWRGRVWPSTNFLAYAAIRSHGSLLDVQKDLAEHSVALMMKEWTEHRHIHENYNADTGEGCDVKNSDKFYHWGALLGLIGMVENGEISGLLEPVGDEKE